MALDPFLLTLRKEIDRVQSKAEHACAHGWSVVDSGSEAVTLISCGQISNKSQLLKSQSHYDFLDSVGLIAVAGDANTGEIRLSGGSVSNCLLVRDRDEWTIKKRASNSKLQAIDGLDRHRQEASLIANLGADGCTLFPIPKRISNNVVFESRMPFIPAYTLGELAIQGRLSFERTQKYISRLFYELENTLYIRCHEKAQESYLDKVERRLSLLLNESQISVQVSSFFHAGSVINNYECRPIKEILTRIRLDARCREILNSRDPRYCHGDLIPEDILFFRDTERFFLIDPNAQNTDPLVDLSKISMSAFIAYDLAIRNWIVYKIDSDSTKSKVTLAAQEGWENFCSEQERIAFWICSHASQLISNDILPRWRVEPRAVMLLAGLQAMAIPVFHALHHNEYERALYFLSQGHLLTEKALERFGI